MLFETEYRFRILHPVCRVKLIPSHDRHVTLLLGMLQCVSISDILREMLALLDTMDITDDPTCTTHILQFWLAVESELSSCG